MKIIRRFIDCFRRKPPTTFQKCLAVHIHFAARPGALS